VFASIAYLGLLLYLLLLLPQIVFS
jgi:hypothetical protein